MADKSIKSEEVLESSIADVNGARLNRRFRPEAEARKTIKSLPMREA